MRKNRRKSNTFQLKQAERNTIGSDKRQEWKFNYLALILVLLRRSANNINLRGAEAEHVVNRDVLHGAISRVDLNVTLVREENNQSEMCVSFLCSTIQGYNTVSLQKSEAEGKRKRNRGIAVGRREKCFTCFIRKMNCPVNIRAMVCLKRRTSCIRFLRKMVFCRRGSWTKPSEKKIIPWGKLCCESQDTTRCFCISGRPVM